ncbi:hypothetical protein L5515_007004 [Caenorhabditis briggsae]|uniref:CUE domain-containing protein n=1 Tax=Caenorhabditis briggsae TaxID=6238 RepID=A0AAE9EXC6_CAEBR|nr:hypothetical protein L5515_007004 [Caenorhabditis briggsae]
MSRASSSGARDVSSLAEETQGDPAKGRFLKKRSAQNANSDYHPSHKKESLAQIPKMRRGICHDNDREEILMSPPTGELEDEDISRLKQATPHLPDDVVLRVLFHCSYDVDSAIELGQGMEIPTKIPESVKNIIVANIAMERSDYQSRRKPMKEFYLAQQMKKVSSTKALIDFYYKEKNKMMGNWRLDTYDEEDTHEEWVEMAEKMRESGVHIVTSRRNPSTVARPTKKSSRKATKPKNRRRQKQVIDNEPTPSSSTPSTKFSSPSTSPRRRTQSATMPRIAHGSASPPKTASRKRRNTETLDEPSTSDGRSSPKKSCHN